MTVLLMAAALGGCSWLPDYANPVEWYRGATGVAQDDAQDQGQRNIKNLEAGGEAPYPNLATVPPPPAGAMSTVDREKLQKGLIADRAHAKYSDEALHQGLSVPAQPGSEAQVATAAAGAAGVPAAAAAPSASPASATPAAPVTGAAPGAATGTAPGQAPARPARHGPPAKGSAPPPQESTLTSPSIGNLPAGEAPHPAPPAPGSRQQQQRQPAQQRQQARLEPPVLRPPSEPSVMRTPDGKRGSVTLEAAEIGFAGDNKTLGADDMQHLADVAKLQKEGGGALRVIGYGKRGKGSDAAQQQLQSFGEALDRANAVMEALTKLGVPAKSITVQAAPELAHGGLAAGQVVVLLEY